MDLALDTAVEEDLAVVRVGGEIDIYSAPQLRRHLLDLIGTGAWHLVLDLEDVDFIDSTGLNTLVAVLKQIRAVDGSLQIVCVHPRIVRLFRIATLPRDFPVYDRLPDALRAARCRPSADPAA